MNTRRCLIFLIICFVVACQQIDLKSSLEEKNRNSVQSKSGQEYEMVVVQNFWGDAKFMRTCVPQDSPLLEPITIYLVIDESGSLNNMEIFPESELASCIKENSTKREFPKPPESFTAKIELSFTE